MSVNTSASDGAHRPISVKDYEKIAKELLPRSAYDYYSSGANDQLTLKRNETAFDDLFFTPKCLVDMSKQDLRTTVLGVDVSCPILIAPTAFQRMAYADGECATARAAQRFGTIMTLSSWATSSIEEVAASVRKSRAPSHRWFQLYVYKNREVTRKLVERAEREGYQAIVLTVDTPRLGRREADVKNKFALPAGLSLKNFDGMELQNLDQSLDPSGLASYVAGQIDRSLGWHDIAWIRSITPLPLILKGIMRPADARTAVEHGVDAIIVSNHGARQLDGVPATIDMLPYIVAEVKKAQKKPKEGKRPVEVYVDGGIRRGTDVLKALALGARAVLVGRPVLWGLTVNGEDGVYGVLNLLKDELELAMSLVGCPTVEDISEDILLNRNSKL